MKNSSAKIYPKGTLVVALYGATVGKTGILAIDAASNQAVCAITPKSSAVSTKFLFWFLRHKRPEFLSSSFGGAQPNISQRILRETPVPLPGIELQVAICQFLEAVEQRQRGDRILNLPNLPHPLFDVKHTVTRIEELAVKIEEARGLRREAVEESNRLLPSIVTQTLTTVQYRTGEVTTESIAHSITDGDHLPPPRSEEGIPFIFISDIVDGKINFTNCKWVSHEYYRSLAPSRTPKRGDVLYTAVGSYGIPCLVDTDEPFCFQRHIAIIKPDAGLILPKYLVWALSSSNVFDQATRAATGSAQLTVPLRDIRKLKFTLPPLPEQQRIVAYLDDLQAKADALKQLQAQTQAELDSLLPSILDKAFRGELV